MKKNSHCSECLVFSKFLLFGYILTVIFAQTDFFLHRVASSAVLCVLREGLERTLKEGFSTKWVGAKWEACPLGRCVLMGCTVVKESLLWPLRCGKWFFWIIQWKVCCRVTLTLERNLSLCSRWSLPCLAGRNSTCGSEQKCKQIFRCLNHFLGPPSTSDDLLIPMWVCTTSSRPVFCDLGGEGAALALHYGIWFFGVCSAAK